MRTTYPLITILPAMPPAVSEIERTPGKGRAALLVVATLLLLIALGAALMLSFGASSA